MTDLERRSRGSQAGHINPTVPPSKGQVLVAVDFSVADLVGLRAACRTTLDATGLDPDRALMFVFAINEGLVNAVLHGGGSGRLTLLTNGRFLVAEIADRGPGTTRTIPTSLPPDDAESGRGLWAAQRAVDRISLTSGPDGTRLRLEVVYRWVNGYPFAGSPHDASLGRQIAATLFEDS
jgi:anti-sigma regulatory factor (Ser/Thr protein kinase)